MNKRIAPLLLSMIGLVAVVALAVIYQRRLDLGDAVPRYSSFRSDAFGTRALFDTLGRLTGLDVTQRVEPLSELAATPARTIILAGWSVADWERCPDPVWKALDAAARGGSRLIITAQGQTARAAKKKPAEVDEKHPSPTPTPTRKPDAPVAVDLTARWEAPITIVTLTGPADPVTAYEVSWPIFTTWTSDVAFALPADSPWQVRYTRNHRPVVIERSLGRGSIVLAGDSFLLSNEALLTLPMGELMSWLVGPHHRIEFNESHLGLERHRGVATLARDYGLAGAFFILLGFAALLVWHLAALFVPPSPRTEQLRLDYQQTAGLEALLRRAVPAAELASACVTEWRRTATPADLARAEAALKALPPKASSVDTYNAVRRALRRA